MQWQDGVHITRVFGGVSIHCRQPPADESINLFNHILSDAQPRDSPECSSKFAGSCIEIDDCIPIDAAAFWIA